MPPAWKKQATSLSFRWKVLPVIYALIYLSNAQQSEFEIPKRALSWLPGRRIDLLFMRILITGICGFVGNALADVLRQHLADLELIGLDNLIRGGSERNRAGLSGRGIKFIHADIRSASDMEQIPPADWVIDAAANASVLAGMD